MRLVYTTSHRASPVVSFLPRSGFSRLHEVRSAQCSVLNAHCSLPLSGLSASGFKITLACTSLPVSWMPKSFLHSVQPLARSRPKLKHLRLSSSLLGYSHRHLNHSPILNPSLPWPFQRAGDYQTFPFFLINPDSSFFAFHTRIAVLSLFSAFSHFSITSSLALTLILTPNPSSQLSLTSPGGCHHSNTRRSPQS